MTIFMELAGLVVMFVWGYYRGYNVAVVHTEQRWSEAVHRKATLDEFAAQHPTTR